MKSLRTGLAALAVAAIATLSFASGATAFSFNDKVNQDIAKKLNIPVFFALPPSAYATLPKTINTQDKLIEFRHPDAKAPAQLGLRIIATNRSGFARRMAQSGLIQTGDILLTFRPEWGGAGTYPNVQMGVSHAGLAFVKDGVVYQIDNPMDAAHIGASFKGDFTSEHYRTLKYLHVIRPRNLTDAQRANIQAWASRMLTNAKRIYPAQVAFNTDYNAPKFVPGKPLDFVRYLGSSALGQVADGKRTDMFCSEFVWSILAMRDCNPATTAEQFKGKAVPACVKAPMTPMKATGDYISRRSASSQAGLVDGPLLVIDSLKLADAERNPLLSQVFVENPTKAAAMSQGHREIAATMQPKFAPLEKYYKDVAEGGLNRVRAYFTGNAFRDAIPDNYSPTSYLINTLVPQSNKSRTMDYVATIMFE